MSGKSRRPVSDERIIKSYQEMKSAEKVAELYGISDQVVYYVLSTNGVSALTNTERRQSRVSDDDILRAYSETLSGIKVAKQLGVNDRTVYRVLSENGVETGEFHDKPRIFREQEEIDKLVTAYSSGRSAVQLSKDYRCSVWAIIAALNGAGVAVKRVPRMGLSEIERAKELYESGLTFKETARILKRSDVAIIRVLTKHYPGIIRSHIVGPGSPHWKGGRTISHGYIYVWIANDDPMFCMTVKGGRDGTSTNYVVEHRLVMARKIGRPLRDNETVHHIDGDRLNNDPSNLQLRQGRHGKHVVMVCLDCGSSNIGHTEIS